MKGLYVLILTALFCLGCSSAHKNAGEKQLKTSAENISATLNYLASDELKGRETGSAENRKAADFLAQKLKENNIKPYFTTYFDTLSTVKNSWNVVGALSGTSESLKNEIIVLGAHYDHIGILPAVAGDSIANGANDNASGSAILLELARNLSLKADNKRTVLIAFFTGEEKGFLGAEHLAKRLKNNGVNVVAMLNFEMLGVPMKKEYMTYTTGYNLSNLAEKTAELSTKNVIGNWQDSDRYQLFKRSDNYPFYQIFKIPSHTISSFDYQNFEYYHHVKDEAEAMDIGFMTNLTDELIPIVSKLINLPAGELRITE